ncbi:MAG: hypothetical protein DDT35_00503 [Firmicutes bacterium]|nr:hypothetical protein [Bacillota bacterium]
MTVGGGVLPSDLGTKGLSHEAQRNHSATFDNDRRNCQLHRRPVDPGGGAADGKDYGALAPVGGNSAGGLVPVYSGP